MAEGSEELARLTRELIGALIARVEANPHLIQVLRKLLVKHEKREPARLHPEAPNTWFRALDLNSERTLSSPPRGRVTVVGVSKAIPGLVDLDLCKAEEAPADESEGAWIVFLEKVIERARKPIGGDDELAEVVDGGPPPDWRVVLRPADVEHVMRALETAQAVTITGMSGSGKTVLAHQVLQRLFKEKQPAVFLEARPHLKPAWSIGSDPTEVEFVGLLRELIQVLAKHAPARKRDDAELRAPLAAFKNNWQSELTAPSEGRGGDDPIEYAFFAAIKNDVSWQSVAGAIRRAEFAIRNIELLKDLATIVYAAAGPLVVVIDDLWGIPDTVRAVLAELFPATRDLKPELIVTSLEHNCLSFIQSVALDIERPRDIFHDFDEPFCLDLISRVVAPIDEHAPYETASEIAQQFRESHLSTEEQLTPVRALLTRLRGHPLAVTVLATAWKDQLEVVGFWQSVATSIDEHAKDWLSFDKGRRTAFLPDLRHYDVLGALGFAWSLLSPANQDRFLDIVLLPADGKVCAPLLSALWIEARRGTSRDGLPSVRLPRIFRPELHPLRVFSRRSMLIEDTRAQGDRPEAGSYRVHDLYRFWIEHEALRSHRAVGDRHADLLKAFGFMDEAGHFLLNEETHFENRNERRKLIAGKTTTLAGKDAEVVNVYLIRNMRRHTGTAIPTEHSGRRQVRLLSSFSYLQARLDDGADSSRIEEHGNVDGVSEDFEQAALAELIPIREAFDSAKPSLAYDRKQLAGQLLARLSDNGDVNILALRAGAIRYAPKPNLIPRFPFLSGSESGGVISALPLFNQLLLEWISHPSVGPAILHWANNRIRLLDPAKNYERKLAPMLHDNLMRAMFVTDAFGAPAILSWSFDGAFRVWDAKTGEHRDLLKNVQMEKAPTSVEWVSDATRDPLLLCRNDDGITLWEASTGTCRAELSGALKEPTWIKKGKWAGRVLTWHPDPARIFLWNPETGMDEMASFLARPGEANGYHHLSSSGSFPVHEGEVCGVLWIEGATGGAAILTWTQSGEISLWREGAGLDQMARVTSYEYASADAIWLDETDGGPAILSWSSSGFVRLHWLGMQHFAEFQHSEMVLGALWLKRYARVVSWTEAEMFLWDPSNPTGSAVGLPHTGKIVKAKRIENSPNDCAIVSWTFERDAVSHLYQWRANGAQLIEPMPLLADKTLDVCPVTLENGENVLLARSVSEVQVRRFLDKPRQFAPMEHEGSISSLEFITDGRFSPFILAGSKDGLASAWDPQTGQQRTRAPLHHKGPISNIGWIEDAFGTPAILVGGGDGNVSLRGFPSGELINEAAIRHEEIEPRRGLRIARGAPCHASWIKSAFSKPTIFSWAETDLLQDQTHGTIGFWDARSGQRIFGTRLNYLQGARCFVDANGVLTVLAWLSGDARTIVWHPLTGDTRRVGVDIGLPENVEPVIRNGTTDAFLSRTYDGRMALWSTDWTVDHPIFEAVHPASNKLSGTQWIDSLRGAPALLSWGDDGSVMIWNPFGSQAVPLHVLDHGKNVDVLGAIWVGDATTSISILSWTRNGLIYLWDHDFGRPTILRHEFVSAVRWLADALGYPAALTFGGDAIRIWNLDGPTEVACFRLPSPTVAEFVPSSQTRSDPLVLVGTMRGAIGILKLIV